MSSRDLVRRYFDRQAGRFDAIYDEQKPVTHRLVDRLFRGVVLERFRLVCNLAPHKGVWTVLDVGCGSGRYAIALALLGASRVVGVDLSARMVEIARQRAAQAQVSERCQFIVGPFSELALEESFDVVVATGYFDYLEGPLSELRLMVERCNGRLFATFPKRYESRALLRKLRIHFAGAYVRFYSQSEVVRLFSESGVERERLSLLDLGRDLLAVARV